jgi:hypothetical protein
MLGTTLEASSKEYVTFIAEDITMRNHHCETQAYYSV